MHRHRVTAPPGYPAARVSGIPAAGVSAARFRAAADAAGAQARRHPAAAAEPVRHLQRRGRLHPGEPEGDAGPDHCRRGGSPDPRADPAGRSAGRHRASSGRRCAARRCRRRRYSGRPRPASPAPSPPLLSAILLSGMLTVVVGRAVFGANITIGEAWQRVRGRLLGVDRLHRAGGDRCDRADRDRGRHHRRRRRRGERRRGIRHRRAAGAGADRTAGLPRHDAQLRAAVDRAGTTRRRSRDHAVVRTGQERLLAGARNPAAGRRWSQR